MGIESDSAKIALLRIKVEATFGKSPKVHNDFVVLADCMKSALREHISETTLERVWRYSKRGYDNVSIHTLDLLSRYAGCTSWVDFCASLEEEGIKDSDMFDVESVFSDDLLPGERLEIGWLPDRVCIIEYQGGNRFVAVKCENSTMQAGDSFSCIEFILNQPCIMDKYSGVQKNNDVKRRYVAGVRHGLTRLKKL